MTREELVARIAATQEELEQAGTIHRRDLTKYIRRMEGELRDYDRFLSEAKMRKHTGT